MIKSAIVITIMLLSSCAGARNDDEWVKGCIFGIEDAARNFGYGVDNHLVIKYCQDKARVR